MTAHHLVRWLLDTWLGHIVLFLIGTGLLQAIFRERTDAEWNALKALRWPQRAYLYWALPTSFVGATLRTIGFDGPKARALLLTAVFGRDAAARLGAPEGEGGASPLASGAHPPLPPPPAEVADASPPRGPT
ncbi:MAG TPA: hypothetical protein VFS00_23850 [Polyangiaceae bacterium]|nr:hypothetical protein [Polyangiaceae bacterium]